MNRREGRRGGRKKKVERKKGGDGSPTMMKTQ